MTANAPTDYAGQQPLAMTYKLLIVHGCDMLVFSPRGRLGGKNIYPGSFPSDSHGPSGRRGPVSSHPGWTSDRRVYVHEEDEESEYANEGNFSRVSKQDQVKSRRNAHMPQRAWLHGSVSKAAAVCILHCTARVAPHARKLLTVRIARGADSFLGGLRGQRRRW